MTAPSRNDAAALLAEAAEAEARVRQQASPATSAFLLVLGTASCGYFLAQPVATDERGVLAATAVYVLAVVGAAVALVVAQGSTRLGFTRRFGVVMGACGAVFAVGLSVGTTRYPHGWGFWLPLAALVVVPCLVGAWRELPR